MADAIAAKEAARGVPNRDHVQAIATLGYRADVVALKLHTGNLPSAMDQRFASQTEEDATSRKMRFSRNCMMLTYYCV